LSSQLHSLAGTGGAAAEWARARSLLRFQARWSAAPPGLVTLLFLFPALSSLVRHDTRLRGGSIRGIDRFLYTAAASHVRRRRRHRSVCERRAITRRRGGEHEHPPRRAGEGASCPGEPGPVRGVWWRSLPAYSSRTPFPSRRAGKHRRPCQLQTWEIHAWAEADHTLRTGEPSFSAHFGKGYWDWLTANPRIAAKFNDDMRRRANLLLAATLPLFDWPDHGTIVDVGGGNGLLLERLLAHRPGLRGVAFDQPHVVAEAAELFRAAGVADRVEIMGGNFFKKIPAGHDVYVLSSILHDWDDVHALRILERCRDAMPAAARLVLFEVVLRPGTEPDFGKLNAHARAFRGSRANARGLGQPSRSGRLRNRARHCHAAGSRMDRGADAMSGLRSTTSVKPGGKARGQHHRPAVLLEAFQTPLGSVWRSPSRCPGSRRPTPRGGAAQSNPRDLAESRVA